MCIFFRLAVDQLCEAEEEEVYSAVVESLISTLKRLLGWFTYHSDTVSATECFVLLQKVYSFVEQTEHPLDLPSLGAVAREMGQQYVYNMEMKRSGTRVTM